MINDNIYACLSFIAYVESMLNYSNGNIQTIKQVRKQFSTNRTIKSTRATKTFDSEFSILPKSKLQPQGISLFDVFSFQQYIQR